MLLGFKNMTLKLIIYYTSILKLFLFPGLVIPVQGIYLKETIKDAKDLQRIVSQDYLKW